jgi:MoxR-like ATPase
MQETSKEPERGDIEAIEKLQKAYKELRQQIHTVIIGQDYVLEQLLTCIFSKGHALLIGVPGLAKTLMVRTLAQCLSLKFSRIQFTPDLMPSDITGTDVIYEDRTTGERKLRFIQGPIFAHIILADEINRTPPKTQAALLEGMQELQVTAGGRKYPLEQPFFVLATQNPIEQEGTYPLPEAQLDRFMYDIIIDYPTYDEEAQITKMTISPFDVKLEPVLTREQILELQEITKRIPVSEHVINYTLVLTRSTRPKTPGVPDFINEWIQWGAGPRASQYIITTAKARAVLNGRYYVSIEDVQAVSKPVLRHRIITNFSAEAEGITPDKIVDKLLEIIPTTQTELEKYGQRLPKVLRPTGT